VARRRRFVRIKYISQVLTQPFGKRLRGEPAFLRVREHPRSRHARVDD
jgi:hypothetical protein